MYNKTENGSIKKYKYLKVIDPEELNSDSEKISEILSLLYKVKCDYIKDPNNDYDMIGINDNYFSTLNKKMGTSKVATLDVPVLLAYNKTAEDRSCYGRLKKMLQTYEFSL